MMTNRQHSNNENRSINGRTLVTTCRLRRLCYYLVFFFLAITSLLLQLLLRSMDTTFNNHVVSFMMMGKIPLQAIQPQQSASSKTAAPLGLDRLENGTMNSLEGRMTRRQRKKKKNEKKNAYTFLVTGCDPDDPRSRYFYHGFLYNVFLSMYTLLRFGSQAEFVLFLQMAAKTRHDTLPTATTANPEYNMNIMNLFSGLNQFYSAKSNPTAANNDNVTLLPLIHIQYLPKPKIDNFYQATMSKFIVLNLTRYSRVMFMDADLLPLCNLDYLFDYSRRGWLKDQVVFASRTEPANGGLFLIRPQLGDYHHIRSIVQQNHKRALHATAMNSRIESNNSFQHPRNESSLASRAEDNQHQRKYPLFDEGVGWGHIIQPPDEWLVLNIANDGEFVSGRLWDFHGGFADQGLLYHWVKYVKMHVSIFLGDQIQNWVPPTELSRRIPPTAALTTKGIEDNINNTAMLTPVMEWNGSLKELVALGDRGSSRKNKVKFLGCRTRYRFIPRTRRSPHKDFHHFTGDTKPWELRPQSAFDMINELLMGDIGSCNSTDCFDEVARRAIRPQTLWLYWLRQANMELGLNIINMSSNVPFFFRFQPKQNKSLERLVRYPVYKDIIDTARANSYT